MNQFIKNIILFLLFFPVAFACYTIIWGETLSGSVVDNLHLVRGSSSFLHHRLNEADTTKNVDVVFLGTSQTYRGFDPRIFKKHGIQVMNLGSSNQTPVQTELIANSYLEQLQPEFIVYEIGPECLSMDGIESAIDFASNSKKTLGVFKMTCRLNAIKPYFSFIYSTYRQLFNRDANFKHPFSYTNDKYIYGGFVEKRHHSYYHQKFDDQVFWKPRKYQKKAVVRTIKTLKNNNANVLLVFAPLEKNLYQSIQHIDEFNKFINSFNLPYYNLNESLNLSRDYFLDPFHLNQQGVQKLNAEIISILKAEGLNTTR